jgi:nucleoside-diphosphate-sugar epimerase
LDQGIEICYGDLIEKVTLPKAVKGIDVVLHLAAIRGEKSTSSREHWLVNVAGTVNLLDSCRAEGVRRFVYCSTVGVMGWVKNPPADENYPLNPQGPYHVTKAMAEQFVTDYTRRGLIAGTVVRPVITYGPNDLDGMIPKLARMLRRHRFVFIGKGTNRLHLVHISNLVHGFHIVLKRSETVGGTYIVADPAPIKMTDIVHLMCRNLPASQPVLRIPTPLARLAAALAVMGRFPARGLTGEPILSPMKVDVMTRDRCYSISKVTSLGYTPSFTTSAGLEATIEWMKETRLV